MAGIETRISNAFLLRPGSMRLLVGTGLADAMNT